MTEKLSEMDKVELVSRKQLEEELAASLAAGHLPDHFLYLGDSGADNWLALAGSDDYDVSARLEELLRASLPHLAARLPASPDVVSLGAGSGRKERLLLEALMRRGGRPNYFPLDISTRLVDLALEAVEDLDPEGCGLVAKLDALPRLATCFRPPVLLCCLGNNFSNFEPDWLLPLLSAQLGPKDYLLVDFHLVPADGERAHSECERRYGCAANRNFNLGPLTERGLKEADCELALELVEWPGLGWRTRKSVTLKREATLRCAGRTVRLRAGTTLQLGFTCKYTREAAESVLANHGLTVEERFASACGGFLLLLAKRR